MVEEFKLLNPEATIIVTGFVTPNDLPLYFSLTDVFVQPSLRDGLPNALLEAMACGRAVIGTPVGGIPDAVTDCENGRLVSTKKAEELARAIEELLVDENLGMRFGNTACQTIGDRAGWQSGGLSKIRTQVVTLSHCLLIVLLMQKRYTNSIRGEK